MKSFAVTDRSRLREAAQRPASGAFVVLTVIIVVAVVVTVQLGTTYWLSEVIRSEFSDLRGDISELRSDVREDIRSVEAKIDVLRSEVGEIHYA